MCVKPFFKKNWKLIVIFLAAFLLRIAFITPKSHSDLVIQSEWGKQAYVLGTLKGFYDGTNWGDNIPNHPPLISSLYYLVFPIHSQIMWLLSKLGTFIALHRLAPTKFIWLFNFAIWFGSQHYATTSTLLGIIILLKLVMITADLSIGFVIYKLCQKAKTAWMKPVALYVLLPFSWYISASWGQSDQLSFIFLLLSIIILYSRKYTLTSPLIFAIAANLKPNCLLILPLYLFAWYHQKASLKNLIIGIIIAILFTLWTLSWFTSQNIFSFTFNDLIPKINTSGGLINFNAFNFWYIFFPYGQKINFYDSQQFLFFSAKIWGLIITFLFAILSLTIIKINKIQSFFAAMFVTAFGSWLFMTGMHERYAFLGLLPLLLFSIYNHKFLKYFLLVSTIFTLNLFVAYWPWEGIAWITDILKSNNYLFSRALSLINIITFFSITNSLFRARRN